MNKVDIQHKLKKYKGSKLRCHLLTHGNRELVAEKLTKLISDIGKVKSDDYWLPIGFKIMTEARMGRTPGFLSEEYREEILQWWLEVRKNANIPNWDIASNCTIKDQRGLLLVEAKAHTHELSTSGKREPTTLNGWKNHKKIGNAIQKANRALNKIQNGWALSRDSHYQLCNRFAWAWKIASLGIPVILIYLGFLDANEMRENGQLFHTHNEWVSTIKNYSNRVVPETIWEQPLDINGTPLWAIIRSREVSLV